MKPSTVSLPWDIMLLLAFVNDILDYLYEKEASGRPLVF
jgi:hypothetical protein